MPNVNTPSKKWEKDQALCDLPETLEQGVEAMRDAARRCRWMYPKPGEARMVEMPSASGASGGMTTKYELRILQSYLENLFVEGVEDAVGEPFKSQYVLDGWREELQGRDLEDGKRQPGLVDSIEGGSMGEGTGTTLSEFMREAFRRALISGVDFILVDLPRIGDGREPLSAADPRVARARPYWVHVRRKQLIDWKLEDREGHIRLAYCRIRMEVETEPEEEYAQTETQTEVREYFAGDPDLLPGDEGRFPHFVIWRPSVDKNGKETWSRIDEGRIRPLRGSADLHEIPLIPVYSHRIEPYRGRPFFSDAAEMQAAHWRKLSEKDHKVRTVATPMLFQSGIRPDDPSPGGGEEGGGAGYSGGQDVEGRLWAEDPSADAKIVETSGASLEALREDLADLRRAIREATYKPLAARPSGPVTATELGLNMAKASSVLEALVHMKNRSVRRALQITNILAGWSRDDDEFGTVEMPTDFHLKNWPIERLASLFQSEPPRISPQGFYESLKKAGEVDDDFDVQREVEFFERMREEDRQGAF